jgi:hypothetical protein
MFVYSCERKDDNRIYSISALDRFECQFEILTAQPADGERHSPEQQVRAIASREYVRLRACCPFIVFRWVCDFESTDRHDLPPSAASVEVARAAS